MKDLGDRTVGSTIHFDFNTHTAAGAPITLAGTPSLECSRDDGTTQDTDGLTLSVDFDSVTGLHHVEVDTSADGTFYAAGHDFTVRLAAGTVDGTSVVGTVVGSFSIQNRYSPTPLDAAGIRTAVGLATNNLDTQLADIPTVAELNARSLAAASYATAAELAKVPKDGETHRYTNATSSDTEDVAIEAVP